MFADFLELDDINKLVRTSREMNRLVTPYMYRRAKNRYSRGGRPYFLLAVDSGKLKAVRHFIQVETRVDVSDTTDFFHPTALHSCVDGGYIEIARLLIDNGATMSAVNGLGWTPLYYAVNHGQSNEALVTLFLAAGADISATCNWGHTLLLTATMCASASMMQLLLHRGADPTTRCYDGGTLLHCAAKFGTAEKVRIFLRAGLNIEATNRSGETPLHCATHRATQSDRGGVVKALLESGANIHAIDNGGLTPLQALVIRSPSNYAAYSIIYHLTKSMSGLCRGSKTCVRTRPFENCDEPVVDQLLSAGANIRRCTISTCSPLDWARGWVKGRES
jgi:ankyrin repeat protein